MVVKKTLAARAVLPRRDLKDALAVLGAVVQRQSVRPVLECVVISLDLASKTVTLVGTDLDTAVFATMPCEVTGTIRVLVRLQTLAGLVKKGEDTVELHVEKEKITVRNGGASAALSAYDEPSEYPDLSSGAWVLASDNTSAVEAVGFAERLSYVARAVSTGGSGSDRYAMRGVLVDPRPGTLTFAATCGRRMHCARLPAPVATTEGERATPVILHPACVEVLLKAVPKRATGTVLFRFPPPEKAEKRPTYRVGDHGGALAIQVGNFLILDRTESGEFPDYERVTPAHVDVEVEVNASGMTAALEQVRGACDSHEPVVRVTPSREGTFKIEARSRDKGSDAEVTCEFEPRSSVPERETGPDPYSTFGMNPDFLLDALTGRGRPLFGWNNRQQPVRIVDGDLTAVIMPITVDS